MSILVRGLRTFWLFILIWTVFLGACTPAAAPGCPTIRIGVIFNTNDPTTKMQQEAGLNAAVKEINQTGIGAGCQVEWITPKTSQAGGSDNPQRNVQDLAAQGAVAIIAPPSDSDARRVSAMSRFFSIPVVFPTDGGDEKIESGGNQWNFRINPTGRDYASAAFDWVRANQTSFVSNAAIFFEHTEYGENAAVAAGDAALKNNISIATYQRFSPYLEDFKDIQEALVNKHPNIIYLISTQPKQAAAIVQAIKATKDANGNSVTANSFLVSGSAFSSPDFLYDSAGKLKPGLDNLILALPWAGNSSRQDAGICQNTSPIKTELGDAAPLALNTVQSYVSLRMIADSVQQLTSGQDWMVNEKKITNWMEMFTTPDAQVIFRQSLAGKIKLISRCQFDAYLWPIEFNADGQNQLTPIMVKISGGNLVPVTAKK